MRMELPEAEDDEASVDPRRRFFAGGGAIKPAAAAFSSSNAWAHFFLCRKRISLRPYELPQGQWNCFNPACFVCRCRVTNSDCQATSSARRSAVGKAEGWRTLVKVWPHL